MAKVGNKLTVKLREVDGDMLISVHDNGAGIEPERLKAILDALEDDEVLSKHIGIKNVYKRLKLIYGDDFVFEIKSELDRFSEVIIIIKNQL